jgi:hypothetical protein
MIEKEVFAECGAWKNFHDMEESLSLDELVALYDITLERQDRLLRTMAAALGAEVEEPQRSDSKEKPQPAWSIDPSKGGEATPLYSENEVASLPINLGYSIIEE